MSQKRTLKVIELEGSNDLYVELIYNKGGMNYFTSEVVERGYKLHVTPKNVSVSNGIKTTKSTAFTGISAHLETKKRFSQKNFDNYIVDTEKISNLVNYVVDKNNLKIIADENIQ